MRNQRSFNLEFKRQAVEELMSGESRPEQLCRRYNITSSVGCNTASTSCRETAGHPNSAIGYRPPNEFEEASLKQENTGIPGQTLLTLPVQ